jgi:hypothetical protein
MVLEKSKMTPANVVSGNDAGQASLHITPTFEEAEKSPLPLGAG